MPEHYEIDVIVRGKDSEHVAHGEMTTEAPTVEVAAECAQAALTHRLSDYRPIDAEG
jgi:hypothetical protein